MSRRSIEIDDELWRRVRADAIIENVPTRVLVARRLSETYRVKSTTGPRPFIGPEVGVGQTPAPLVTGKPHPTPLPSNLFHPVPKPTKKGRK